MTAQTRIEAKLQEIEERHGDVIDTGQSSIGLARAIAASVADVPALVAAVRRHAVQIARIERLALAEDKPEQNAEKACIEIAGICQDSAHYISDILCHEEDKS